MKVLLTAYEPFDHRQKNASQEIVSAMPETIGNCVIEKRTLPVTYDEHVYSELLNRNDMDILILCGEAVSREKISLEVVALNLMMASIPDNKGVMKSGEEIFPNGENAYFSNIDLFKVIQKLPSDLVALSYTAGTFICNFGYYCSLHLIKAKNLKTLCLFVHFPLIKELSAEAPISLMDGVEFLKQLIVLLGEHLNITDN